MSLGGKGLREQMHMLFNLAVKRPLLALDDELLAILIYKGTKQTLECLLFFTIA